MKLYLIPLIKYNILSFHNMFNKGLYVINKLFVGLHGDKRYNILFVFYWVCELKKSHIISTDEDPGLRIESSAVINLHGVSTNKILYYICY